VNNLQQIISVFNVPIQHSLSWFPPLSPAHYVATRRVLFVRGTVPTSMHMIQSYACVLACYEVGLFESNGTVNVLVFEVSSDFCENWK
jgi:hypothetical protein